MAPGPALDLGAGRVRRVRPRHQRFLDRHEDLPGHAVRAARPTSTFPRARRRPSPPRSSSPAPPPTGRSAAASTGAAAKARNGPSPFAPPTASTLRLEDGGSRLSIGGERQADAGPGEYPDIYREFAELIDERRSHVDVAPLRLVADCLLAGRRHIVEAAPD